MSLKKTMCPVRDPATKIKSAEALKRLLSKLRSPKKKVVFTNGCFDLLHKGHVSYLLQARKLGAFLVVALNEDESIKKAKGSSRPINKLIDRAHLIASLECVDYVTWFSETTPLELIKKLKPNILVKGGDYQIKDVVGAEEVLSWGGETKTLPFVEGYSTTALIQKMK